METSSHSIQKVKITTPLSFDGVVKSGHTCPVNITCVEDGKGDHVSYVVKLHADLPHQKHTCARELLGSLMGQFFGLRMAEPAIVFIPEEFCQCVNGNDQIRFRLKKSLGLNYGSKKETTGLSEFFVEKDMLQRAADVFAFDVLIQNPDRRTGNHNLFQTADDFILYDHEMAFPFSRPQDLLGGCPEAWELSDPRYRTLITDHCLYKWIKGELVSFEEFSVKLAGLSSEILDTMISELPTEWQTAEIGHIKAYLLRASEKSQLVKRGLQEILAQ